MLRSRTPLPVPPGACDDRGVARLVLILSAAAVLVIGGAGAALLSQSSSPLSALGTTTPEAKPSPSPPVLAVSGSTVSHAVTASWKKPLTLGVTDGTLRTVTATGPQGAVAGRLTATGWTSTGTLVPSATYRLHAVIANSAGSTQTLNRTVNTTAPSSVLRAITSPNGNNSVGVGQPIILHLNHSVRGAAARAAFLQHVKVTSSPSVPGAWRFFGSTEVHYRPADYWAAGTRVTVVVDLRNWRLPDTDTWGSSKATRAVIGFGDSMLSTVDITAHTMTVRRNGQVIRTMKVSTGRDKYPTKGGVHIILTVEREHQYNSATVGIPTNSPDGYFEKLPYSMRISNAGAFVHANPATVKYQGRLNVSHGCVNLSLEDAKWFYEQSHRGDIVNIIHAVVAPVLSDPGMSDWNESFSSWKAQSLG